MENHKNKKYDSLDRINHSFMNNIWLMNPSNIHFDSIYLVLKKL